MFGEADVMHLCVRVFSEKLLYKNKFYRKKIYHFLRDYFYHQLLEISFGKL